MLDYKVGFSQDSEILTEDGWKLFSCIDKADSIATLNSSWELEYQNPIEVFSWDYSGDMINHKSQAIDFLVTPNKEIINADGTLTKLYDIVNSEYRIFKSCKWSGHNVDNWELPEVLSKTRKYPVKYVTMEDWLKFFGAWISEGSCFIPKNRTPCYVVSLGQSNKSRFYEDFKYVFEQIVGKVYINDNNLIKKDKQLYNYLNQFGKSHDKFIPKQIKGLTTELLLVLLEYLLKGDGSIKGNCYSTCSKQLADDVQEIALKVGKSASIFSAQTRGFTQYYVQIQDKRCSPILNTKGKGRDRFVSYSGKVYNVTVPNGVIYVRRNGKACWFPNFTKRGYQFERETAALAGEHGKRMPRSGGYGTEGFVGMVGDVHFKFPWMNNRVISIECKHGYSDKGQERKSMRIDRAWFEKHMQQAKMADFLPAWAMKFKATHENGMSKFVMIPFSTMKEIIKEMDSVYSELQELKNEQAKHRKAPTNRRV